MNKELMKLYEWLCINRLSLNISKTNFVVFHAKNYTNLDPLLQPKSSLVFTMVLSTHFFYMELLFGEMLENYPYPDTYSPK